DQAPGFDGRKSAFICQCQDTVCQGSRSIALRSSISFSARESPKFKNNDYRTNTYLASVFDTLNFTHKPIEPIASRAGRTCGSGFCGTPVAAPNFSKPTMALM